MKSTSNAKRFFSPIGNFFVKYFREKLGILIGLFVMVVVVGIASEYFFKQSNLMNLLRQVNTNALLAFAITLCLIIGGIDLSVGSVVALGGVVAARLIASFGFAFYPALICAILVGTFCGFLNGFIISRTKMPPFIVTLAMLNIIRGAAYLVAEGVAIKVSNDQFYNFGNGYIAQIPIPVIIFALVGLLLTYLLNRTVFGRHMYGTGGNREAAVYTGINIKKVEVLTYMISGSLASLAGVILASRVYSGQPTAGNGFEADAIAAAVLGGTSFSGGRGTVGGTIIGALIIGVLANGLNLLEITYYWQTIIKGIIIMLAVYFDILRTEKIK